MKIEVIEQFQINFLGHSTFEEIWTDQVSRANGSPDSNTRVVHGFLELEVRIVITVLNKVVNNILFNMKQFNS